MAFFKDFKSFLMKGDIVALATAVVIGGAFKAVINSMVKDIIMPLVGLVTGGKDFSDRFIVLSGGEFDTIEAAKEAGANIMTYGNLITTIIDFVFIGLIIFIILKGYEKTKKKEEEAPKAPPAPSKEEVLLGEIRDLLKK